MAYTEPEGQDEIGPENRVSTNDVQRAGRDDFFSFEVQRKIGFPDGTSTNDVQRGGRSDQFKESQTRIGPQPLDTGNLPAVELANDPNKNMTGPRDIGAPVAQHEPPGE